MGGGNSSISIMAGNILLKNFVQITNIQEFQDMMKLLSFLCKPFVGTGKLDGKPEAVGVINNNLVMNSVMLSLKLQEKSFIPCH